MTMADKFCVTSGNGQTLATIATAALVFVAIVAVDGKYLPDLGLTNCPPIKSS